MSHPVINHAFYDAIVHFDESEDAKEYYYKIMNTEIIRNGCESVQEELTPDAMLHLIRCCFRRVRSSFHTCRCTVGSVP